METSEGAVEMLDDSFATCASTSPAGNRDLGGLASPEERDRNGAETGDVESHLTVLANTTNKGFDPSHSNLNILAAKELSTSTLTGKENHAIAEREMGMEHDLVASMAEEVAEAHVELQKLRSENASLQKAQSHVQSLKSTLKVLRPKANRLKEVELKVSTNDVLSYHHYHQ